MSLPYSLIMLWRERSRFIPAIMTVAFSAILIAVQSGFLIGLLSLISLPIDQSGADIWLTPRGVESITLSQPVPESWSLRLAVQPEVDRIEYYLLGLAPWHNRGLGSLELCCVIGTQLEDDAIGCPRGLPAVLRAALSEPGTVVVDESELGRLGLSKGVGEFAEIADQRVRVVGVVKGVRTMTTPYVMCSLRTARRLLPAFQDGTGQTMYVVARCRNPRAVAAVAQRLCADFPDMAALTCADFSTRTRMHWLIRTKAGLSMAGTTMLALLVGLVITSQTLYAACLASLREYAVLDALGIPRWRLQVLVLAQSFWIGFLGVGVAVPGTLILGEAALLGGMDLLLPPWLLGTTTLLTLGMALLSGLGGLRALRLVEPMTLLR